MNTWTDKVARENSYIDAAEAQHDAAINGWGDDITFVITNVNVESPALRSWACSCGLVSPDHYIGDVAAQRSADNHQDAHDKGWVK